ncbi:MAG TPA: nuclear transport factor 2 family protein [Pyrinomonadaceae bacterium]|jgi:ketosteroid isomerase-like protein
MKTIGGILFLSLCAALFIGCGAPAGNTGNSNANSNASKPTAAAPTVDSLMAMEKSANEAYTAANTKWFTDNLSSKFTMSMGGKVSGKDQVIAGIGQTKCDVKNLNVSDGALGKINDDTYVVTYKLTGDGSCSYQGHSEPLHDTRAATVWVREGDGWKAVYHGENTIIDPKNPPKADDKKADAPKADDKKASDKSAANSNSVSNSNSTSNSAPAPPAKSPNTDALVTKHQAGWEAWRKKDENWLNTNVTDAIVFVDPAGGVAAGKAAVVKGWMDMKCDGVTKTSFTNGYAVTLSPTAELLFGTGNADGSCDGQKNGDTPTAAVYVKDGSEWKLAFMIESMPESGM